MKCCPAAARIWFCTSVCVFFSVCLLFCETFCRPIVVRATATAASGGRDGGVFRVAGFASPIARLATKYGFFFNAPNGILARYGIQSSLNTDWYSLKLFVKSMCPENAAKTKPNAGLRFLGNIIFHYSGFMTCSIWLHKTIINIPMSRKIIISH